MTGIQTFLTRDRRTSPVDRRQRQDRRAHALPEQHTAEENKLLHELLREAHARIRTLEQAVDRLAAAVTQGPIVEGRRLADS
jgi:hypothetical protein